MPSPAQQFAGFLARFSPEVRAVANAALDKPVIKSLISQAIDASDAPFDRKARRRMIIRVVSKKQRPRRPRA